MGLRSMGDCSLKYFHHFLYDIQTKPGTGNSSGNPVEHIKYFSSVFVFHANAVIFNLQFKPFLIGSAAYFHEPVFLRRIAVFNCV